MLPDRALHIERSLDARRSPAVAPALDIMRIMEVENGLPRGGQLHRKKLLVLRRVKMTDDDPIDFLSGFWPQTHTSLLKKLHRCFVFHHVNNRLDSSLCSE